MGRRKLGFERIASTAAVRTRGNFGIIPSPYDADFERKIRSKSADKINHVGWFLNQKDNVDSSYFLEVAASEFKVQGLEIDYSLLAWDADLRRSDDDFDYFKFRGTRWNHVNNLQQQKYLKNAYRVLMTRARQGVVIFIPEGVDPEEDSSRSHFYYDDIYKYLRSCGIIELE